MVARVVGGGVMWWVLCGGWLVVGGWCNANAGNVDSDLNYFSFPGVWDSLLPCMISLVWT